MNRAVLSPQARRDLDEIWIHIALDSIIYADRFVDRLYARCIDIAQAPLAGRARPEYGDTLRSFPFGDYLVFYRPTSFGIEVVRILSGKRDLDELLK